MILTFFEVKLEIEPWVALAILLTVLSIYGIKKGCEYCTNVNALKLQNKQSI